MFNKNESFSKDFEMFEDVFKVDKRTVTKKIYNHPTLLACDKYKEFAQKYAGASFNQGIFRFYDAQSGPVMQSIVEDAFFNGKKNSHVVFASDWLGRQYAIDPEDIVDGEPQMTMFDVEENTGYRMPTSFWVFMEEGLLHYQDITVCFDMFEEWLIENDYKKLKSPYNCAGMTIPASLGGDCDVANLKVIDMAVYWSLTSQITGALEE